MPKPSRKKTGPNHPAAYTKGWPLDQDTSTKSTKNIEDYSAVKENLNDILESKETDEWVAKNKKTKKIDQ